MMTLPPTSLACVAQERYRARRDVSARNRLAACERQPGLPSRLLVAVARPAARLIPVTQG